MRIHEAQREVDLQEAQMDFQRKLFDTLRPRVNAQQAQSRLAQSISRYRGVMKPWLARAVADAQSGDSLDLVAIWYIMYRPDLLRKAGLDLAL